MRNTAPATETSDFEPMSLIEAGRLAVIVGCSALIAIAGFFSQADAAKTGAASVVVGRNISPDERFARAQINNFERMLGELTERAELETDPVSAQRMKSVLVRLGQQLDSSKRHMERLQRSAATQDRVFSKEDMRGSLLALQEAGAKAVSLFIDADMKTDGQATARAPKNIQKPTQRSGIAPASFTVSASSEPGSDQNP